MDFSNAGGTPGLAPCTASGIVARLDYGVAPVPGGDGPITIACLMANTPPFKLSIRPEDPAQPITQMRRQLKSVL